MLSVRMLRELGTGQCCGGIIVIDKMNGMECVTGSLIDRYWEQKVVKSLRHSLRVGETHKILAVGDPHIHDQRPMQGHQINLYFEFLWWTGFLGGQKVGDETRTEIVNTWKHDALM